MKLMVVGSGGREHALCWKLAQSAHVDKIYCAPGNGGTAGCAKTENLENFGTALDFDALTEFCLANAIDLVVIGPDNPLADGIVDHMSAAGLKVFGPTRAQAKLEWSKAHAKEVLARLNIASARFATAKTQQTADAIIKANNWARVIKADGLALGKGVFVCDSEAEAIEAVDTIFNSGKFHEKQIVIEEELVGDEISLLTLCDGKTIKPLLPSQDHKRRLDEDRGPNTGGMGAYAPVQLYERHKEAIDKKILAPLAVALKEGKLDFKGVLYIGLLMHTDAAHPKNEPVPYVLEFNARFGDPETETILPLLESDLYEALSACCEGTLDKIDLRWSDKASCCVIGAYKDYPVTSANGEVITLSTTSDSSNQILFHAGTALANGNLVAKGGRVFAAVGTGENMASARENAYKLIAAVQADNLFIDFRRDIAQREAN